MLTRRSGRSRAIGFAFLASAFAFGAVGVVLRVDFSIGDWVRGVVASGSGTRTLDQAHSQSGETATEGISMNTPTPTPTGSATPGAARAAGTPVWGLAGGYHAVDPAEMYDRGVRAVLVEIDWSSVERSEGAIDAGYLQNTANTIKSWQAKGYKVVLNYGIHHAPEWLLAKPGARFVNQLGHTYTASDQANLVWNTGLRPYAERYTQRVFEAIRAAGASLYAVRVGGGRLGELHYPLVRDASGNVLNYYWAFDPSANAVNPVRGWKPGSPSPNGEARKFLDWYLNGLRDFQNWQIATVRRYAPAPYIAVLYASYGMRPGDFDKAVANDLRGATSAERNGEVQSGYDFERHIKSIIDPKAAVWGTWAENVDVIGYLARLANGKGLPKMGENSGQDDVTKMTRTVGGARQYGLSLLMWIRAEEAYCRCSGYATIDDYQRLIRR